MPTSYSWTILQPVGPPFPPDALAQPITAQIDENILIASPNDITDTTRNDNFLPSYDNNLWISTIFGTTSTQATSDGLIINLFKDDDGSSFELLSEDAYVSGDLLFEYEIKSPLLTTISDSIDTYPGSGILYFVDVPTNSITYAGLEMLFTGTGNTLTIKRSLLPGINGHQISVVHLVDGRFAGGANYLTTDKRGVLRLIKHENVIAALYNDQLLMYSDSNEDTTFQVRLFSTTEDNSEYLSVKYKDYQSTTGVMLGNAPILNKSLVSDRRISGTIPESKQVGLVDINIFNHSGLINTTSNGFEYPLILGQHIFGNNRLSANVQNDEVVRN